MSDLSVPSTKREVATGTDGRRADANEDGEKKLTPKWTPQLTPTVFSGCDLSSAVDNEPNDLQGDNKDSNCLVGNSLGKESHHLATVGTGKKGKPTVAFKPTTTGLQDQSSTVELRWHNYFQYKRISTSRAVLFYIEPEIVARKIKASCTTRKLRG